MSLYGNIFLSSKDGGTERQRQEKNSLSNQNTSKSNLSMKLLQDHLMSKKRAKHMTSLSNKLQKTTERSHITADVPSKLSDYDWDPMDEYDPMMPCSYEVLQTEYIKLQEQKMLQPPRKSAVKFDPSILDVLDKFDDDDIIVDTRAPRGNAIAPPTNLQKVPDPSSENKSVAQPQTIEKLETPSAAAKIMAKMGYKAGQGLGKDAQGISTPLEVEKSGACQGRIVQKATPPVPSTHKKSSECPEDSSTRVLLLRNMVGPGEVDDELEVETKEECGKYGEVIRCLIYEIPGRLVPDDEAVRIFVEFKDVLSAKKAASDLDGRYFGGRVVKATFYNVEKFSKYELSL